MPCLDPLGAASLTFLITFEQHSMRRNNGSYEVHRFQKGLNLSYGTFDLTHQTPGYYELEVLPGNGATTCAKMVMASESQREGNLSVIRRDIAGI